LLKGIPPTSIPEPQPYLEHKVWLNLRDQMEKEIAPAWRRFFAPRNWAAAGTVAALVIAAFLAGRFWQHPPDHNQQQAVKVDPQRIALVAVGDHLERSQILLTELMHTDSSEGADLSEERQQARNLLDDNRLYRLSALRNGDPAVAHVLDDLERVLVEIANAPADPTSQDVQQIRNRIQSQDLLFKIHVMESKVTGQGSSQKTLPATQRL
jgi:hypothetical protein